MLSAARKLTQQRQSILWKRNDLKLISPEIFGEFNTGIPLISSVKNVDQPTKIESTLACRCLNRVSALKNDHADEEDSKKSNFSHKIWSDSSVQTHETGGVDVEHLEHMNSMNEVHDKKMSAMGDDLKSKQKIINQLKAQIAESNDFHKIEDLKREIKKKDAQSIADQAAINQLRELLRSKDSKTSKKKNKLSKKDNPVKNTDEGISSSNGDKSEQGAVAKNEVMNNLKQQLSFKESQLVSYRNEINCFTETIGKKDMKHKEEVESLKKKIEHLNKLNTKDLLNTQAQIQVLNESFQENNQTIQSVQKELEQSKKDANKGLLENRELRERHEIECRRMDEVIKHLKEMNVSKDQALQTLDSKFKRLGRRSQAYEMKHHDFCADAEHRIQTLQSEVTKLGQLLSCEKEEKAAAREGFQQEMLDLKKSNTKVKYDADMAKLDNIKLRKQTETMKNEVEMDKIKIACLKATISQNQLKYHNSMSQAGRQIDLLKMKVDMLEDEKKGEMDSMDKRLESKGVQCVVQINMLETAGKIDDDPTLEEEANLTETSDVTTAGILKKTDLRSQTVQIQSLSTRDVLPKNSQKILTPSYKDEFPELIKSTPSQEVTKVGKASKNRCSASRKTPVEGCENTETKMFLDKIERLESQLRQQNIQLTSRAEGDVKKKKILSDREAEIKSKDTKITNLTDQLTKQKGISNAIHKQRDYEKEEKRKMEKELLKVRDKLQATKLQCENLRQNHAATLKVNPKSNDKNMYNKPKLTSNINALDGQSTGNEWDDNPTLQPNDNSEQNVTTSQNNLQKGTARLKKKRNKKKN
uniref:Uncharacterized protein n=2 Tax=Clytia hemisphaerica TaxID=252671 RepID=A0A7M5X4U5_9CNID